MKNTLFQILIATLPLFMISCGNSHSTLSLLTNDSIKCWCSPKDQYGLLLSKKNRLFQEFDGRHYIITTNPLDFFYPVKKFKIKGNTIEVYYDKKKGERHIENINIVRLTKDTLWLGTNDNPSVYISTSEIIKPQYDPVFYEGYTQPVPLFNRSKVDSLINNVKSRLSADDTRPDTFQVDFIVDLDTNGNIEKLMKVKEIPADEKYNKFYDMLLNSCRSLRFSPAMNKIFNERYKSKFYISIKR